MLITFAKLTETLINAILTATLIKEVGVLMYPVGVKVNSK